MVEKKFNLLYEPWIPVLDKSGAIREVSLLNVFKDAHNLKQLAGELPTQDAALLRLLLAVLHCVFTRQEADGTPKFLANDNEAIKRWQELWNLRLFPYRPIEIYLKYFEERFYLFHPETPFYQVADLQERKATLYEAPKLIGDLSESGNKVRLFAGRSGRHKRELSYAEAARWLLYLNSYDDTSAKPSVRGQNMLSPGAGYLGKLGFTYVAGGNLFETLMLNFVLKEEKGKGNAIWETSIRNEERCKIPPPDTQMQLLTLQSRRVIFLENGHHVTGYKLLGGDFFDAENYFDNETMTIWFKDRRSKDDLYKPKRHDFWRDFASLTAKGSTSKMPGLIKWISDLVANGTLMDRLVWFKIAVVKYGDKDFFVDDVFGDGIMVNVSLFSEVGEEWVTRICDNLEKTEKCVWHLKNFVEDIEIAKASGDEDKKKRYKKERTFVTHARAATEQAYFNLDIPFRRWLAAINPQTDDMEKKSAEWLRLVQRQLLSQGELMLRDAGDKALTGENNAFVAHAKFKGGIYNNTTTEEGEMKYGGNSAG